MDRVGGGGGDDGCQVVDAAAVAAVVHDLNFDYEHDAVAVDDDVDYDGDYDGYYDEFDDLIALSPLVSLCFYL